VSSTNHKAFYYAVLFAAILPGPSEAQISPQYPIPEHPQLSHKTSVCVPRLPTFIVSVVFQIHYPRYRATCINHNSPHYKVRNFPVFQS